MVTIVMRSLIIKLEIQTLNPNLSWKEMIPDIWRIVYLELKEYGGCLIHFQIEEWIGWMNKRDMILTCQLVNYWIRSIQLSRAIIKSRVELERRHQSKVLPLEIELDQLQCLQVDLRRREMMLRVTRGPLHQLGTLSKLKSNQQVSLQASSIRKDHLTK